MLIIKNPRRLDRAEERLIDKGELFRADAQLFAEREEELTKKIEDARFKLGRLTKREDIIAFRSEIRRLEFERKSVALKREAADRIVLAIDCLLDKQEELEAKQDKRGLFGRR